MPEAQKFQIVQRAEGNFQPCTGPTLSAFRGAIPKCAQARRGTIAGLLGLIA